MSGDINFKTDVESNCSDPTGIRTHRSATKVINNIKEELECGAEYVAMEEMDLDILSFKPVYLISKWIENFVHHKWLSISIILPTGIGLNYTLTVIDNESIMQICLRWLAPTTSTTELHCFWL